MKKRNQVAFFNILSVVLLQGISFFTAPLFMRLLGDSGYGITQVYNTWVAILAIVFTLQTQYTLANARVEYPEGEQRKYQSSVMSLSVLAFAICAGVVVLFIRPIGNLLQLDPYLVALMLVQAIGTYSVNFLTARNVYEFKAGQNMLLSLTISIVTIAGSVALILILPKELGYYGRITAIAGTYGLIGIPICIWIMVQGKTAFHREYWKFCVTLSVPAVFYNLSDLILGQSDKLMLQYMLDEAAVGQYAAALNFSGIMYVIFGALNNSWCPFFFEDKKNGEMEALKGRTKNFLELFTVLSLGFLLLSREVYFLFAGRQYTAGTGLIPVFVTSYFLNFLCTFPINYEYYYKKTKVVAAVTISCSIINIGLNYLLICALGMTGAVIATATSHGIQLAIHYVYVRYFMGREDYPFDIKMWMIYPLIFACMVAFVYLSAEWWLVRWGLGAAIGVFELLRIRKRKVLI